MPVTAGGRGQGYLFSFTLDGREIDFENCRVRSTADEVDTTGSLLYDPVTGQVTGTNDSSVGGPFTDAAGGPGALFIEFSGTLRNLEAISYLALMQPGFKYNGINYLIYYDSLLWVTGTGIYVQDIDVGAVVRGAASVSARFRSTQEGYVVNNALLT